MSIASEVRDVVKSRTGSKLFIIDVDLPTHGRFSSRIPIFMEIELENGAKEQVRIGDEVISYIDRELKNELDRLNDAVKNEVSRHSAKLKSGIYVTTEGGVERIRSILDEFLPKYKELEEKIMKAILEKETEYVAKTVEYIEQKNGKITVRGLTDGIKLMVFPLDQNVEQFIEKTVREVCRETVTAAAATLVEETKKRLDELAEKLRNSHKIMHLAPVREALSKEIQALEKLAAEIGIDIDEEKKWLIEDFRMLSERFASRITEDMYSGRAAALIKKLPEFYPL